MRKTFVTLFGLMLLLAACTPSITQTPVQPERVAQEASTIVSPTAVSPTVLPTEALAEPADETAIDVINPPIALGHGVLVTTFRAGHLLWPVDPLTGEDLVGYEPLNLGTGGLIYAFSSDGRFLVADGDGKRLQVVDIATWQVNETGLNFFEVMGIAFSPDNSQLAVVHGGAIPKLALIDISSQTIRAETRLSFLPRWDQVDFTQEGVFLYGTEQQTSSEELATTLAHVGLFSAEDASLLWETSLPGVMEGVSCEADTCEKPEDPRTFWQPAVVLAPDGRSLYIVHADADQLTTVNIADRTVQTLPIAPALSWLERLITLTADTAYAKEFDFISKNAVLSPDGSKLYVTGWHSDLTTDSNNNPTYVERPLGLQIIDTATGTQIATSDIGGSSIYLSPDGNHLYMIGWEMEKTWTEILDANSLESVTRLNDYAVWPATHLDGQPVLLASQVNDHKSTLGVIDPATFAITTWSVNYYADWITVR